MSANRRSQNDAKGSRRGKRPTAQNKGRNRPLAIPDVIELTLKTLSPELQAILTNAGYSIRIEFQSGGTLIAITDSNGRAVGGKDELLHLASARSFVAEERRNVATEELLDEQGAIVLYLVDEIKKESKGWEPPSSLSSEFLTYLKTAAADLHAVDSNLQIIGDYKTDGSEEEASRTVLTEMCEDIIGSIVWSLKQFLKNGKLDKDARKDELLRRGVPKWFVTKLMGRQTVPSVKEGGSINRILFSATAKSWCALSIEEWKSEDVIRKITPIMRNSFWLLNLLRNDTFLRDYCKIDPAVSLEDKTNPQVQKLYESKASLVPHCLGFTYAFEPLSKGRDQGFLINPRFDNAQNSIISLSQAISRTVLGCVQTSDVLSEFWEIVFPEINFDRSRITKSNNIFRIALDQATGPIQAAYIERLLPLSTEVGPQNLLRYVMLNLNATPHTPQGKALVNALDLKNEHNSFGKIPKNVVYPKDLDKRYRRATNVRATLHSAFDTTSSEARKGAIADTLNLFPAKRKRTENRAMFSARSQLSKKATKFIKEKVEPLSSGKVLGKRLKTWFTGFQSEEIQAAAAKMLAAQFDELFREQLSGPSTRIEDGEESSSEEEDSGTEE
jgi:hypothetical protein